MGTIVLHAGMWKTGSTSIQWWLGRQGPRLRESAGTSVLRANVGPDGAVQVAVHRDARLQGAMHSNEIGKHWGDHPRQRRDLARDLFAQLGKQAGHNGTVVISAESLSRPFWMLDEEFVGDLNELAAEHDVRVAYYVRPQHTALEASWRQAGFQRPVSPAEFFANRSRLLDYHETYTFARRVAPDIRFVMRPFRRDLLHGGNVVADFAHHLLGMEPSEDMEVWENRGLPLDAINVLRSAPTGRLWRSPQDNRAASLAKELMVDVDIEDSQRVRLSRLVLQQACHERFEPSNRQLISALGWETDAFVPAVDEDIGDASFERLNELWRPQANEAEQILLHHTMARLLEQDEGTKRRGRGPDAPSTQAAGTPTARSNRVVQLASQLVRRSIARLIQVRSPRH